PFGFVAARRHPALLNVHGGPATQYGHGFFDEFQVYAGAGYGVIYLNPRGSQGYGEGFARAVVGDWGGGDHADVMAGLDAALARARAIRTPLLIIHSEDDLRCPMEQAEQLFVALRRQRKEVVLVRFPDESHDLSRTGRPRHRLERFRIILEWFGRHLEPGG